jgi:hypothetical protein
MAGNSVPIYSKQGAWGTGRVTAANTSSQGDGTIGSTIFLAFTADATNGSYIQRVRWSATANAAATTTTATVGRVFVSNIASGSTTSSNTFLWQEIALPSVSADATTTANYPLEIPMNFALPPGYTILVTNHAAPAANTAWIASVIAGNY